MLQLTAKCLDVSSEVVNEGSPDAFSATTITCITGDGARTKVERVRVGRDFVQADFPKVGEEFVAEVGIRAYAGRNGAGYSLTAWRRIRPAGLRAAASA